MQKWEYLFVNTKRKGDVWFADTINGKPIDSNNTLLMYDYANQLGEDGWELQSATGEELSALLPSVLDRAFKGEL